VNYDRSRTQGCPLPSLRDIYGLKSSGDGSVDDNVAHEGAVDEGFKAEILIDVGEFRTTTLNTLLCLANVLVERSRTTGVPVYFRT